jgi:hypothetical protein
MLPLVSLEPLDGADIVELVARSALRVVETIVGLAVFWYALV